LSFPQLSPADDAAGDLEERFVDVGQPFESDAQAAEVVQPSVGAFDDPAGLAQAATVRFAATGDLGGDAGGVQRSAVLVVIVAAVGLDDGGFG
jgi:hypothetical protein